MTTVKNLPMGGVGHSISGGNGPFFFFLLVRVRLVGGNLVQHAVELKQLRFTRHQFFSGNVSCRRDT